MSETTLMERDGAAEERPKRRAVMDAAETLFLEHGYGAVSMDAIARAAGVSKATLYAHFPGKDQLFASIVAERGLNQVLDETAFPAQVADLPAALRAIGGTILRFMLRPRTLAIYRVAVAESARFPELGRAFYESGPNRTRQRLADWLVRQQAAGLVQVPDPDLAAQQLAALLRSCVFMRAALGFGPAPAEAEIDATVAAAVETWMKAFGRERAPPPA